MIILLKVKYDFKVRIIVFSFFFYLEILNLVLKKCLQWAGKPQDLDQLFYQITPRDMKMAL